MIEVYAQHSCGCCRATMKFTSEESATNAFCLAGLGTSRTITDDAGDTHEDIDTFYGFWTDPEAETSDLMRLFNTVSTGQWPKT